MNDFLSRVEAILSGVMNFNPKSRVERLLMKWVGSVGNVEDLETYDKSSLVAAINEVAESGGGGGGGSSAFIIDYSNPRVDDYTNAVARFNANKEVKLHKGDVMVEMTGYDANHCFFGGTISAYLPGGYVIAAYAHIGPNGENYFWYEYRSTIDGAQKPFVVTITQGGGLPNYTADKTNAEIYAAWQAGREVIALINGGKLPCLQADATSAYFNLLIGGDGVSYGLLTIITTGGSQTVTETMSALQLTTIVDAAGYYTRDTVEGALEEIGAKLAAYPSDAWEGGSYGG